MRIALVTLLVVLGASHPVAAAKAPCPGCTLEAPETKDRVPLLVVLHGDREHAAAAAARWLAAARKQGWALLSLECPSELGCKASWWQWDGDPAWIREQVAKVAAELPIDPARIYLAGWSGGASYLGAHAQAWPETFAAVVIHGGGMAPASADCPGSTLPAYFLVGDRNPLHRLAKALRDYFETCKQDVTWDLIAGADHGKEEAALRTRKAEAILDWLDARRREPQRLSSP